MNTPLFFLRCIKHVVGYPFASSLHMSYEELRLLRLGSDLFMSSSVEDVIFRPRMFPPTASNRKWLLL